MTEQELRDKIIGIVLDTPITGIKIREIIGGEAAANSIADALISAEIEDVSEWKHKAERADRALKDICKNIRIDSGDNEDEIEANSDILYKSYLKQAEKELQEKNTLTNNRRKNGYITKC